MECNNASEWCFDLSLKFYSESHPEAQCDLKSKIVLGICINGFVKYFLENIKKDLCLASVC